MVGIIERPDYESIRTNLLNELEPYESVGASSIDKVIVALYVAGILGDSIKENSGGLAIALLAVENWDGSDGRVEARYFSPKLGKEVVYISDFTPSDDISKEDFVDALIGVDEEVRSFEERIVF